ncbi:cilia- and flagella-associated protein 97-like [Argonauta hians]
MDEDDLNGSVDFDFYDSHDQDESMSTVFDKVYSKPPPGRQRVHFQGWVAEKVGYNPNFCGSINGCLTETGRERENGATTALELAGDDNSVGDQTSSIAATPTTEDCTLLAEENDTQSGLDVSISDDTDSNLSDLPDFSDDDNDRNTSSFGNKSDWCSKPAGDSEGRPVYQLGIKNTESRGQDIHSPDSTAIIDTGSSDTANSINSDLSSVEGDDVAEDISNNESDDDDDDDDSLTSVEDNSEDEDESNEDSSTSDKYSKTLENGKSSQPQAILRKNVGITLAERFSLQQKTRAKRNGYPQGLSRNDLNCNNFESDCSSASEMTDVSPLASGDSSPTMVRKNLVSDASCQPSSPPFRAKNGLCAATDHHKNSMDMNLIMRAVQEISKEECSRDSSPIRKKNHRTNLSYSSNHSSEIERENERLLSQILKLSTSKSQNPKRPQTKTKVAHSAINRQREQRRIERENEIFLRRLQSVKPTKGMSRSEVMSDYGTRRGRTPHSGKVSAWGPKRSPTALSVSSSSTAVSDQRSFVSFASGSDRLSVSSSKNSGSSSSSRTKSKLKTTTTTRPEWMSRW